MDPIRDLIVRRFCYRPEDEKKVIVSKGRPTPCLQSISACAYSMDDLYSWFGWLTAEESSKALFCWTCLLFNNNFKAIYNPGKKAVFSPEEDILDIDCIEKHGASQEHLQSLLDYHVFVYKHGLRVQGQAPGPVGNDQGRVEERVRTLLRTIKVVTCAVERQCSDADVSGKPSPVDSSFCLETLRFFDALEACSIPCQDIIQLLESRDSAVDDIVSGLATALRRAVKDEVQRAPFVSVVLCSHGRQRASIVLRYVLEGRVLERFVRFCEVKQSRTADVAHGLVSRVLEDFGAHEKVVACAVDGGLLACTGQIDVLQARLRDDYPFVRLAPAHLHDLDSVLEQRLSVLPEVGRFLRDMRCLKDFVRGNDKVYRLLNLDSSFAGLAQGTWSDSQFLAFLADCRAPMVGVLRSIVERLQSWEPEDLPRAVAFLESLQSVETAFLLRTSQSIFKATSKLKDVLLLESSYISSVVATADFKKDLAEDRGPEAFEALWGDLKADMGAEDTKDLAQQLATSPERKAFYSELYRKIHGLLSEEVSRRLSSASEMLFFHLFDPEVRGRKYPRDVRGEGGEIVCRVETPLDSLLAANEEPFFERGCLENELEVFFGAVSHFPHHLVPDLLAFFRKTDLTSTFRNLTRAAELILAMPCQPPSPQDGRRLVQRIELWAPLWEGHEDLVLLCVECGLLDELKDRPDFLDAVVLECAAPFRLVSDGWSGPPVENARDDVVPCCPVIVDVRSLQD